MQKSHFRDLYSILLESFLDATMTVYMLKLYTGQWSYWDCCDLHGFQILPSLGAT